MAESKSESNAVTVVYPYMLTRGVIAAMALGVMVQLWLPWTFLSAAISAPAAVGMWYTWLRLKRYQEFEDALFRMPNYNQPLPEPESSPVRDYHTWMCVWAGLLFHPLARWISFDSAIFAIPSSIVILMFCEHRVELAAKFLWLNPPLYGVLCLGFCDVYAWFMHLRGSSFLYQVFVTAEVQVWMGSLLLLACFEGYQARRLLMPETQRNPYLLALRIVENIAGPLSCNVEVEHLQKRE